MIPDLDGLRQKEEIARLESVVKQLRDALEEIENQAFVVPASNLEAAWRLGVVGQIASNTLK